MKTIVHDNTGTLTSADIAEVQSKSYPFDVHVLLQNTSRDSLEDAAHSSVTSPNAVAIGIDPIHHHVVTRFGTATGVKTADYDSIAKAGNAHFRAKEWAAGIDAIALRAQASAQAKTAMAISSEPVVVEQGLSTEAWCGIGILFAAVVVLAVWMWRRARRQQDEFNRTARDLTSAQSRLDGEYIRRDEDAEFDARLRNASAVRQSSYSGPSVPIASGSPVIVNQGNSNDGFLTGMIVGEALSSPREVVREREVIHERDSGGSSSSWSGSSSDYSSSSSDDSGGSSSSWDSGSSGFDFGGGGGFDGGGGGGDW